MKQNTKKKNGKGERCSVLWCSHGHAHIRGHGARGAGVRRAGMALRALAARVTKTRNYSIVSSRTGAGLFRRPHPHEQVATIGLL